MTDHDSSWNPGCFSIGDFDMSWFHPIMNIAKFHEWWWNPVNCQYGFTRAMTIYFWVVTRCALDSNLSKNAQKWQADSVFNVPTPCYINTESNHSLTSSFLHLVDQKWWTWWTGIYAYFDQAWSYINAQKCVWCTCWMEDTVGFNQHIHIIWKVNWSLCEDLPRKQQFFLKAISFCNNVDKLQDSQYTNI